MLTFRENLNGLHIQNLAATECYELIPMGSREKITIQTLQVFEQHRKIVLGGCSPRDYQPRYLCLFCQKSGTPSRCLGRSISAPKDPPPRSTRQGNQPKFHGLRCCMYESCQPHLVFYFHALVFLSSSSGAWPPIQILHAHSPPLCLNPKSFVIIISDCR